MTGRDDTAEVNRESNEGGQHGREHKGERGVEAEENRQKERGHEDVGEDRDEAVREQVAESFDIGGNACDQAAGRCDVVEVERQRLKVDEETTAQIGHSHLASPLNEKALGCFADQG